MSELGKHVNFCYGSLFKNFNDYLKVFCKHGGVIEAFPGDIRFST